MTAAVPPEDNLHDPLNPEEIIELQDLRYRVSHQRCPSSKIFKVDILNHFNFLIITELIRNIFYLWETGVFFGEIIFRMFIKNRIMTIMIPLIFLDLTLKLKRFGSFSGKTPETDRKKAESFSGTRAESIKFEGLK